MRRYNFIFSIISIFLLITSFLLAQPVKTFDAAQIELALKKLNTLGSVLYIAAHPDDENTAFLSYCSSGKLLRTGYLSITRGDGGQNLIGDEQGGLLGVIRTQELLQARRIDGAEQFFTRAIDFGYTKSAEETFKLWNKEKVLSDVVWIIRRFRPDVIVTRFPTSGEGMHGQHTASAILALEGFKLAGDSSAFPAQLEYVNVWQPKRIYWNGWTPAFNRMGINSDTLISINIGAFNRLLGKSYTEISAESRSMHKSQGFGSSGWRGNRINYFLYMDGKKAKNDLFDGIDQTWNRVKDGKKIGKLITKIISEYDPENPERIIPDLITAYSELGNIKDDYWAQIKGREILELIRACAGIWIEAISDEQTVTPGSDFVVKTGIVNRSTVPFVLEGVYINYQAADSVMDKTLLTGEFVENKKEIRLPDDIQTTQPYWLRYPREGDLYNVPDQTLIGLAQNSPPLIARFRLLFNKTSLVFSTPVQFRKTDPTKGEVYSPLIIAPLATANFENSLYIFPSNNKRKINVILKNFSDEISGELKLSAQNGWQIEPSSFDFDFENKSDEKQFTFTVSPPSNTETAELTAKVIIDDKSYTKSSVTINYDHIPRQVVFPEAKVKLLKLDLGKKVVNKIGYIKGSGDKIPGYLRELGYEVNYLTDTDFSNGNLSGYDVIIAGIRAYNTDKWLAVYQPKLMEYVENGGTYIVQYNTTRKKYAQPGPYGFNISHDRVTEENAKVKFINPNHPLLNFPNKITEKDFNGWIQERGLYFANEWDNDYEPVLEMNDITELPKKGSLLYARYGDGVFIYTGLSFFRELPAGVPGAYRLFINLISAGKYDEQN
ncbi:mycothiol S-conjugate amidase [bacterium BMS3Abin03]|nr:mycothiol S-conjugate amidase [bacterium BMS3Abin03]